MERRRSKEKTKTKAKRGANEAWLAGAHTSQVPIGVLVPSGADKKQEAGKREDIEPKETVTVTALPRPNEQDEEKGRPVHRGVACWRATRIYDEERPRPNPFLQQP